MVQVGWFRMMDYCYGGNGGGDGREEKSAVLGGCWLLERTVHASCTDVSSAAKSIDGRRLEYDCAEKTEGFRRLSCLQLSQRPPEMLTRPRHPLGWFTQEYIFIGGFEVDGCVEN